MRSKFILILLFAGFSIINASACTIFSGVDHRGHVLVSNNEDHIPNMNIFFKVRMATDSTYGFFGTIYNHPDGWLQGGSNDQGLFFDTNELGYVPLRKTAGTKPYSFSTDPGSFVLQHCKNVDEVVLFFNTYRIELPAQVHVADKSGRFAIINNDTIIYATQPFQLSTNFHPLHHDIGVYPCWRYNAVSEIITREGISPGSFEKAMFASAQHGNTMSIYMNSGDLTTGDWTFYMFGYRANSYKFNIRELLMGGDKTVLLKEKFNDHPYFKYYGRTGKEVESWKKTKKKYDPVEKAQMPKTLIWNFIFWETNYKAACQWLDEWWKETKHPTAEDWMTRGIVQMLNNYQEEAYESFNQALRSDPSLATARHYLSFLSKDYPEKGTTISLHGFADAKVVSIGGLSMNPNYYLMHRNGDRWEIKIPDLKGTITYFFLVDGKKVMDPENPSKHVIPTVAGPVEMNILVLN